MSQPYEVFGSQDLKDDDGAVIDSLLIETNAPPTPVPEPITVVHLPEPPKPGRLLTGYQSFTAPFATPMQVLPADAKRKSITLSVFSEAASPAAAVEFLSVADESGKVGTSGAWKLRHGKDPVTLDGYTGAVWANASPTITAALELTWVSVTG
jgi:hypothetical protein